MLDHPGLSFHKQLKELLILLKAIKIEFFEVKTGIPTLIGSNKFLHFSQGHPLPLNLLFQTFNRPMAKTSNFFRQFLTHSKLDPIYINSLTYVRNIINIVLLHGDCCYEPRRSCTRIGRFSNLGVLVMITCVSISIRVICRVFGTTSRSLLRGTLGMIPLPCLSLLEISFLMRSTILLRISYLVSASGRSNWYYNSNISANRPSTSFRRMMIKNHSLKHKI